MGSLGSIEGNIYGSARNEGERPNETGLFLLREKWNLNLEILSQLSLRVLIKVSSLQSERNVPCIFLSRFVSLVSQRKVLHLSSGSILALIQLDRTTASDYLQKTFELESYKLQLTLPLPPFPSLVLIKPYLFPKVSAELVSYDSNQIHTLHFRLLTSVTAVYQHRELLLHNWLIAYSISKFFRFVFASEVNKYVSHTSNGCLQAMHVIIPTSKFLVPVVYL